MEETEFAYSTAYRFVIAKTRDISKVNKKNAAFFVSVLTGFASCGNQFSKSQWEVTGQFRWGHLLRCSIFILLTRCSTLSKGPNLERSLGWLTVVSDLMIMYSEYLIC